MHSFIVGGAGFIGSHLADLLVERGPVTVFDNLSNGRKAFLDAHIASGRVKLIRADATELASLVDAMPGHDIVFHLAANPEARWGLDNPRLDLEQGTIATWNVIEAARRSQIAHIVFASSGTVYGNNSDPCGEMDLGQLPISLYGASKLAGEAMVAAYVECFGLQATICRFGNVVGPRGTHGAILDFCNKLRESPERLEVLGDGRQSKPYLHVTDCAAGLLYAVDHGTRPLAVYNLTPPDWTSVARIAELCVKASPSPSARIVYRGGTQGWPGDVPHSRLVPDRLGRLGFSVRYTSDEAVECAVRAVAAEVFGNGSPTDRAS